MHITYDAEANVFSIELQTVPARDTIDIEEGVSVLVDEDGHIVSLEVAERGPPATRDLVVAGG